MIKKIRGGVMTLILKSFLKWCPVVRSMNWKILCAQKNWPEKSCVASTGWEEGRGHTRVFEQMTMPSFPMLENSELTGTSFSEMHGPEDQLWQCSGPPQWCGEKKSSKVSKQPGELLSSSRCSRKWCHGKAKVCTGKSQLLSLRLQWFWM